MRSPHSLQAKRIAVKISVLLLLGLFQILIPRALWAQRGVPLFVNYAPDVYGASKVNHAVVQDNRGVVYVGNDEGVLEFDGVSWRKILLPGKAPALKLGVDSKNVVYVASKNEIGRLAPDSLGTLQYQSLSSGKGNFGDVKQLIVHAQGVYFITDAEILRWDGKQLAVAPVAGEVVATSYKDIIYQSGVGPIVIGPAGSLSMLKGSEKLRGQAIKGAVNYFDKFVIFATDYELWTYQAGVIKKVILLGEYYLKTSVISSLALLQDGTISVGTERGGVVFYNTYGQILNLVNKASGLLTDAVTSQYIDRQQALWICTPDGLSRIEAGAPVTEFNENLGLKGAVNSVINYSGYLYVGTERGLYYLNNKPVRAIFAPVKGIVSNTFALEPFGGRLFAATSSGIFYIDKDTSQQVSSQPATALLRPRYRVDKLLVGLSDGLAYAIGLTNAKKMPLFKIRGLNTGVQSITEDQYGGIWLTCDDNILRLLFFRNNTIDSLPNIAQMGAYNGLPSGRVKPFYAFKRVVFGTQQGLYQYDYKANKFLPDSTLGVFFANRPIDFLYNDLTTGEVYVSSNGVLSVGRYDPKTDQFSWSTQAFKRMPLGPIRQIVRPLPTALWIAHDEGLLRFEPQVKFDYQKPFHVLLRKVLFDGDSLLFDGYWPGGSAQADSKTLTARVFLEGFERIRFDFAALSFDALEDNRYQFILEGYEEEWSSWTKQPYVEFRNLPVGAYTFRVRAQNSYGQMSDEAIYTFIIEPKWYKTKTAITLFIIGGILFIGLLVFGFVKMNSARLERRNRTLEALVQQRTAEIAQKNTELERINKQVMAQNDKITEQNRQIEEDKRIIEEKNKDITDSIVYAKRIQEAILPKAEVIRQALDNYFVLYQPRDIVSGDFYWFSKKNGPSIFAAGDCTGHGVPGALMSMIGNSLLNQIVNEAGITKPSEILNALHHGVHTALRQYEQGSNVRDGMDIVVTAIDFEKRTVQVSSAMRPYYRFSDGELIELKGDKFAIGGTEPFREFTNHEFEYRPGETLYMFSDGYADQFGGPDGRKFQTRRFKQILLENINKSMQEQLDILNNEINTWKGDYEQVDDIMVVGIRF